MDTIRGRLTLYYFLALTATIGAFAGVIYLEHRRASDSEARIAIQKRLVDDADYAQEYLKVKWQLALNSRRDTVWTGGKPREIPATILEHASTMDGGEVAGLTSDSREVFKGMRAAFYLADRSGRALFVSDSLVRLDMTGLIRIQELVRPPPTVRRYGVATFSGTEPPYYYLLDPVNTSDPEIATLLVVARPPVDLLGPRELLQTMAVVAPLIILVSALLGYWLAGRSLRTLDVMVEELEGIQDGTSLHRRILVPTGEDELARLGRTLNAMLGRVEQSFMTLRRFTADASHELKTPLMVLRAGVERSLIHPDTPDEVVGILDESLAQLNWMSELVGNLLTLARADEGRASLDLASCDLSELITEVWETAELLAEENGLAAVTLERPARPVKAVVDHGRIHELLLNLITNAIKYTPAGGRVAMRLFERQQAIVIEVEDTGVGIAPGDIPHIFERFWRVDKVRTRGGEKAGSGLGLAISQWIVEAHGGTIQVKSRPGRGTTFTVTLPSLE